MCSCNKGGAARAGGTPKFTHTYKDATSGSTKSVTYSSEMEARRQASLLGGTVRAA